MNVCRICLQQSSELVSIYDTINDSELTIFDKISLVTKIQKDESMPSLICSNCLADLECAYRFLQNFQSSEEILRSSLIYVKETRENDEQELPVDDFYGYDEGEIIVHNEDVANIEAENLQDVLNDDSKEECLVEEEDKLSDKPRKNSKKEKSSKLKKSNQRLETQQQQLHICEICANQYKYRHALEVHMRRHRGKIQFFLKEKKFIKNLFIR